MSGQPLENTEAEALWEAVKRSDEANVKTLPSQGQIPIAKYTQTRQC